MTDLDREDVHNRIIRRLDQLDDETLQQLDAALAQANPGLSPADADAAEPKLLTRRQLLAGLLAGGVVVGGTNLGTAWYAREQGEAAGLKIGANAGQAQAMTKAAQTRGDLEARIEALRGLVSHYEALERIDLDQAVAESLERFQASLAGLQSLTGTVVDGIGVVRSAVDRFESALPAIRQGIANVDDALDALDERMENLRQILSEVLRRTGPVAETLEEFLNDLLDLIPFGIGGRLRQVIEAVPAAMTAVRERLLGPMRATWFAEEAEGDVQSGLLTPVRTEVLDPAEQLLADLDDIAAGWQRDVAQPIQRALNERRAVRQALDDYKQRHGLT